MDGTTFDLLTRRFGALASRRRLLAGIVASILGAGFAVSPDASFASPARPAADGPACTANGKTCRKASDCCSQKCGRKGEKGKKVCKPCAVSRCGASDNVCNGPVCSCNGDESCGCWQRVGGGGTCASILQGACVECDSDSVCVKLFGVKGARCILTEVRNCSCPYGLTTGCVAPCGNACMPDGLQCESSADCCSGVCGCRKGLCFCRHETCGAEKAVCTIENYDLDCCEGKCKPVDGGPVGKCVTRRLQ